MTRYRHPKVIHQRGGFFGDGQGAEVGASGVGRIRGLSGAMRRGTDDPWLDGMLKRKPPMLVAAALANRMARIVWAVSTKKEFYRAPAAA